VRRARRGAGTGRSPGRRHRRGDGGALRATGSRPAGRGDPAGRGHPVRLHSPDGLGATVRRGTFPPGVSSREREIAACIAMIRNSTRRQALLFLLSDLAATAGALVAAYSLRFRAEILPVTKGVPGAGTYLRLLPVVAVLWPLVYYFYGLYHVRRNRSR